MRATTYHSPCSDDHLPLTRWATPTPTPNQVGYTVRHESRKSKRTRVLVVTEGVLVRRLQLEPTPNPNPNLHPKPNPNLHPNLHPNPTPSPNPNPNPKP